jgi:hypothetical protein
VYNEVTKIGKGVAMLKKYMIAILVFLLLFSTTVSSFASETDDTIVNEEYVYIVSPEIGTSNKAIINDTLFISIYVQSDSPLFLELTRVSNFGADEITPIVTYNESEVTEEKVIINDVIEKSYSYTKEDILYSYRVALREKELLQIELNEIKRQVAEIESIEDLSDEELELLEKEKTIESRYNFSLKDYLSWKEKYMALFETVVLDNVPMTVDPAFPYFESSLDNIQTGQYHLTIKRLDGSIIEELEFEVVTEDIFAEEILEEDIFDDLIDVDVFN